MIRKEKQSWEKKTEAKGNEYWWGRRGKGKDTKSTLTNDDGKAKDTELFTTNKVVNGEHMAFSESKN